MLVSATILLLSTLPIIASLLLSLPEMQNRIVDRAAKYASAYLGTEVKIGRIDVTMTGRISISDFLSRDLQGDTLIYIRNLDSRLLGYRLATNHLLLGSSNINGGMVNLQERENGEMNIRQVVLLLTPERAAQNPLQLLISNIKADSLQVIINRKRHLNPAYGVDVGDLELNDISLDADNLLVNGPAIHADIRRLSLIEKSGFAIRNITGELYLTQGAVSITDAKIESQWSELNVEHLWLADKNWRAFSNFNNSTLLDIAITGGYLSSDDVAYFAPPLRSWGIELQDIEVEVTGRVNNLNVNLINATFSDESHISAELAMRGLPNVNQTTIEVDLYGLTTNVADIEDLKISLTANNSIHRIGVGFSREQYKQIEALGQITVSGSATGQIKDFNVDLTAKSNAGDVTTQMRIEQRPNKTLGLEGALQSANFDLREVTKIKDIGFTSMRADLAVVLNGKASRGRVKTNVKAIEWKGYTMTNTIAELSLNEGDLQIEAEATDPNLKFKLGGFINNLIEQSGTDSDQHSTRDPYYNLLLNLEEANLSKLAINKRDSISSLAANVRLMAEGRSLESMRGAVTVQSADYDFLYRGGDSLQTVSARNMRLGVADNKNGREIAFTSSFADVKLQSRSEIKQIVEFAKNSLREQLPSLYAATPATQISNQKDDERASEPEQTSTEEMTSLDVTIYNVAPITPAITPGFRVGEDSRATIRYNAQNGAIDAKIAAPYLEYKSMLAFGLNIFADSTTGDSSNGEKINIGTSARELFIGANQLENCNISGAVADDKITLTTKFENKVDSLAANLSSIVTFQHQVGEAPIVKIKIPKSHIDRRNTRWSVSASDIEWNRDRFNIEEFEALSANQLLHIDGCASKDMADSLNMRMRNFDLSILTPLIAKVGYELHGVGNGSAVTLSALDKAHTEAHIELDSIKLNNIAAPPLALSATWDSKINRARLFVENRDTRDTLVRGYYIPSQVKYFATIEANDIDMGLLDPPLRTTINNTTGAADARLTLQGERRMAKLNGEVKLRNIETSVNFTNVRYKIDTATLQFVDNRLVGTKLQVDDKLGNGGDLNIDVDMNHLKNITFNISAIIRKMLVLNTTERDNDIFYGDVFASGAMSVEGGRSGVKMNIAATSDDNSHFYMPLSDKSTAKSADFITFTSVDTTDYSVQAELRRKLLSDRLRRTQEGASSGFELNMALDVKPNVEVQLVIDPTVGDIIKARGEGKLNMVINPKSNIFDMYGEYVINEGSYLFTLRDIINKRFVIEPGSTINWNGSPLDAILNINAIYKLKTSLQPLISDESTRAVPVDCIINLTDNLMHPTVTFDIELPSTDTDKQAIVANLLNDQETLSRQFFYLMLANSFIPESSNAAALGVSTSATTGLELLTNQLSNWLSTSNYNVVIRYRPESNTSGTGDEVDLGFSKGFINNRLLMEVEGNYISDNRQTETEDASPFMGEAYITWLIDQAGALRLRGFTQTIDRFDENYGLQETGLGIYYREDFNNFKDLREKVRERFKASPERLEKREERRANREHKEEDEDSNIEENK
ncbi:MAG: translocation/assembly module TamB domain-containing protein [Rikenellaceae bacterium]